MNKMDKNMSIYNARGIEQWAARENGPVSAFL